MLLRALEGAGLALGGGQEGRRVVVVLHLRASHSHNVLSEHCLVMVTVMVFVSSMWLRVRCGVDGRGKQSTRRDTAIELGLCTIRQGSTRRHAA
jgi:hypothetical protein